MDNVIRTHAEKDAKRRLDAGPDPWQELANMARAWKKKKSTGWTPDLTTKDTRPGIAEIVLGDGHPRRGQAVITKDATQGAIAFLKSPAGRAWLMGFGLSEAETRKFVKELGKPTKPKQTDKMSLADEIALRVGAVKTKDIK